MYEEVRKTIEKAGHNIFGVTFIKADGSVRRMTARLHVAKPKNQPHPQGIVDRAAQDAESGTMTVYDMNCRENGKQGAYRRFRLDMVKEVQISGEKFRF